MKRVLTIAGSDSGGGAGIQADLKTITVLGSYGISVITALTAQNTVSVRAIHEIPAEFVDAQLRAVLSDIGADAAKTGMLASPPIIKAVASGLRRHPIELLVVDPVMVAKSGDRLLRQPAEATLKRQLLPLAYLVTPNLPEAEVLCGFAIRNLNEMRDAAKCIHGFGARHVLIKGGHFPNEAIDLLYDGHAFHTFEGPRLAVKTTHGTGCTYSAALATLLAQGYPLRDAVARAKQFITSAIRAGLDIGAGHGPTNPFVWILRQMERPVVLTALEQACERLTRDPLGWLVPEVRSNLGYALQGAYATEHVAAFPGRLTEITGQIVAIRRPEFGASRHIASVILTAMHHRSELRSAMNIRYTPAILDACRRSGLVTTAFNRAEEPTDSKQREGSTLEWGTNQALSGRADTPDLIWDEGDIGKEPMIRLLGKTPQEVVDKLRQIAGSYRH